MSSSAIPCRRALSAMNGTHMQVTLRGTRWQVNLLRGADVVGAEPGQYMGHRRCGPRREPCARPPDATASEIVAQASSMMWEYGLDQYVLGVGPYQRLDEF